ncbi:MAG: hypothetical protein HYU57_06550 [Micavibrio aeruginosavorus]|nr:hypothetical protein [Micavibrio aeruginosavorus]
MSKTDLNDLVSVVSDDKAAPRERLVTFLDLVQSLEDAFEASTGAGLRLSEETKKTLRSDPASGFAGLEAAFAVSAGEIIPAGADSVAESTKFALTWKDLGLPFALAAKPADAAAQFCAPLAADARAAKVADFAEGSGYKNYAKLLKHGCNL